MVEKHLGVHVPGGGQFTGSWRKPKISHRPKRMPNGMTKAKREAEKSDDPLKWDFRTANPLKKRVTDMTEIKAKDAD